MLSHISLLQVTQQTFPHQKSRGHGGRVVTLLPPTSEIRVRFPARPQVEKLVVTCCWSAVYSTETSTHQLYVLVSSALPTTHRDAVGFDPLSFVLME